MKTDYFSADGVIHTVKAEKKKTRPGHSPKVIERMNRNTDVCLNCTRKKCRGSDKCFKRQREGSDND